MIDTRLLVIGAGPYGLSVAALARERGIETVTLGRPMGFWREHMPEGMLLRSGLDWHLDDKYTLSATIQRLVWGQFVFDFKYSADVRLSRDF